MIGQYEALFIFKPIPEEEKLNKCIKDAVDLVTSKGGVIKKDEPWGKRVLAYPIKKLTEGVYYLIEFEIEKSKISELRREYNLNQEILRVLIVVPHKK